MCQVERRCCKVRDINRKAAGNVKMEAFNDKPVNTNYVNILTSIFLLSSISFYFYCCNKFPKTCWDYHLALVVFCT